MNRLKWIESAINDHITAINYLRQYGLDTLQQASEMLCDALMKGRGIYICGNGGSAADAQHIAGELVCRFQKERRALRAMALNTDTALLTALSNDYHFDRIFERQVEALVREGDVLWALSTSGSSPNVLKAAACAGRMKARVLSFTGKPDTPLEELSTLCFCAHCDVTARAQEVHVLAYHVLCDLIEKTLFPDEDRDEG